MDTSRALYKITPSSPGTEAAADASAALAAASMVFKGVDSTYSSKLLNHAQSVSITSNIHSRIVSYQRQSRHLPRAHN